jgi:DNA invertase Pin-like site-specific DNA recombinase
MARIILPQQPEESEKPWRKGSSRPELDLTYSVQLYPRVSTKEQLKNISAEMQQDKSFALNYGWTDEQIIMDPADLGKSGQLRMDQRSAFLGMLGRIRNSIVKTVIAAQVDRFFREKWGVEYGKFMQICCEYNVKVVTLTHDRRDIDFIYDFSISWHIDQFRRECEQAYRYLERYVGRMHGARNELQRAGVWACGSFAVGYVPDYRENINGKQNPNYHRYTPHDEHRVRVTYLFERNRILCCNVNELYREISVISPFFPAFRSDVPPELARMLSLTKVYGDVTDEEGNYPIIGYDIGTPSGLRSLLSNPAYIGHWVVNNQIVRYNNHPAIVDEDDFMYAFGRLSPTNLDGSPNMGYLEARSRYAKRHYADRPAILKGCIVCSDPGFVIYPKETPHKGREGTGKVFTVYAFYPKKKAIATPKSTIAAQTVDGFFLQCFKGRIQETDQFDEFLTEEEAEKKAQQEVIANIDMLLRAAKASLLQIEDQVKRGLITNKELAAIQQASYEQHQAEVARLESEKARLTNNTTSAQKRRSYRRLLNEVMDEWIDVYPPEDLIPPDEYPEMVELFVEKAFLDPLSPRFYQLTILWRDPAWGVDKLVFFRSGNPSINWSKEEDTTIRRLWPQASKEELLAALPIRSWTALRHRASRLKVRRLIDEANTNALPETVSWQDVAVMTLYNVTEETLRKETGAKLIACANAPRQDMEKATDGVPDANLGNQWILISL